MLNLSLVEWKKDYSVHSFSLDVVPNRN
jgi:hypothetical protein